MTRRRNGGDGVSDGKPIEHKTFGGSSVGALKTFKDTYTVYTIPLAGER